MTGLQDCRDLSCLKEVDCGEDRLVVRQMQQSQNRRAVLGLLFVDLPFSRAIIISTFVKSNCLSILIDGFCINTVGVCEDVSTNYDIV